MQDGTRTGNGDVEEVWILTKEGLRSIGHVGTAAQAEKDQVAFVTLKSVCG
jgi:hypothetical protein